MVRARVLSILAVLILVPAAATPVRAAGTAREYVPLDVFQLLARAHYVLHGQITHGAGRLAEVKVLENFKGEAPDAIRVDFRDLNIQVSAREEVVLRDGDEYVLFLDKPDFRKPSPKKEDIFEPFRGRAGLMLLPPEGAGAVIEAMRSLAPLVSKPPNEQEDGLRQRAQIDNSSLRRAALEELLRLEDANPSDLAWLQKVVQDRDPAVRRLALQMQAAALHQLGGDEAGEGERSVLETIRMHAHVDPDESVRVEATKTLGAWPVKDDVIPDLQSLGVQDGAQSVRYEARRLLFLWGKIGPS
jgi:HEAT repeat protein